MPKQTKLDAGLLFSNKASGALINGFDAPCEYTPEINPCYVLTEACRDIILWFLLENPDPLWICGPTGCGQSSAVRQIAARLNYPVYEITGNDRLETPDLIGHLSVHGKNVVFDYGPLSKAMKEGGIFLFNEIDLCSPATLAGLNTVLDGSPLCIAENQSEIIKPNPMFRLIVTANSSGSGDESGLYQGIMRQNLAFADRFICCEMTYPSEQLETALLQNSYTQIPPDVIHKMVSFANDVRKQFMGANPAPDAFDITCSTRSLLRWAQLAVACQPLAKQGISPVLYALDRALVFRASTVTRAALRELATKYFPQTI